MSNIQQSVGEGLHGVAESAREQLASLSGAATHAVDRASGELERAVSQLRPAPTRSARFRATVKAHPAWFIAGAFVAGVAVCALVVRNAGSSGSSDATPEVDVSEAEPYTWPEATVDLSEPDHATLADADAEAARLASTI